MSWDLAFSSYRLVIFSFVTHFKQDSPYGIFFYEMRSSYTSGHWYAFRTNRRSTWQAIPRFHFSVLHAERKYTLALIHISVLPKMMPFMHFRDGILRNVLCPFSFTVSIAKASVTEGFGVLFCTVALHSSAVALGYSPLSSWTLACRCSCWLLIVHRWPIRVT